MVLEDASEAIHAWTGERSVPLWAEPLAGESCAQCRERLCRSRAHNCRLCGLRFCSLCTAKYHVPERFRRKAKSGAARCCYACVASCIQLRDSFLKPARPRRPGLRMSMQATATGTPDQQTPIHLHPPIWELARKSTNCLTCERPCGKGHICRVCGSIYCSECSVKMKVPSGFRKKGKCNPVRVCCQCRFDLFGGAVLDESEPPEGSGPMVLRPQQQQQPLAGTSNTADGAGSCPGAVTSEQVTATASMKNDSKHLRSLPPPPLPSSQPRLSGADLASSSGSGYVVGARIVSVSVQWHLDSTAPASSGGEMLTVLKVNEDMALDQIYDRLLQQLPELADASFGFLCRGKLVLRDFWDVFQAKHVRPVLYLVREQVLAASALSLSRKSAHVDHAGAGVSAGSERASFSSGSVEGAANTEKQEGANGESASLERASALFSHEANRADFLSFSRGDIVQLLIRKPRSKWWYARIDDRRGWIPSNYFEIVASDE